MMIFNIDKLAILDEFLKNYQIANLDYKKILLNKKFLILII